MLTALESCFGDTPEVHWQTPGGGLYVWLELPESVDTGPDSPLWEAAVEQGMIYVPGEYCCPELGVAPLSNAMRLSYGAQSPTGIQRGIELLAAAMRESAPAPG